MHKNHLPKPPWIRSQLPGKDKIGKVSDILRDHGLNTVCEEANCPNRAECFCRKTATFMIMGNLCTRNCRFCNVTHGKPLALDPDEPAKVADAVARLGLKYVVITSVTRDDLPDGGAEHFCNCIKAIKNFDSKIQVEILTPDFQYCLDLAVAKFSEVQPDVFNHNVETVPRLYASVRPQAKYDASLKLLRVFKEHYPHVPTKSGLMLGLGETEEELVAVFKDLRSNNVDKLTLGQYLQPTCHHLPVVEYVTPEQFDKLAVIAKELGFTQVKSGPLVRSSYMADNNY
jgi:lipoic acid synthetase